MEFLKDLVKYFLEGMIEWLAECKISSKIQEYFINKKVRVRKVVITEQSVFVFC